MVVLSFISIICLVVCASDAAFCLCPAGQGWSNSVSRLLLLINYLRIAVSV